ncbi:putative glycosyltransferase [Sulfolobus filamentous virus 1]|uniref:Putative glycosyltransferase n=2 Tax=Alphalipothrixvirus beppuense TaxID=2734584 RepID=A0A346LU58_SUFV1|nr:putative glycosyltransferase [Sulfolobus filamentous virus 1]AXQ00101.1 putative glycosyltransferase [Sulfolobus filamentous virus 1]AZI75721.1 putative glycosyltransferase [Sulfolobales Beppu filamentous phage 1]
MKGYGWENQVKYEYVNEYPSPSQVPKLIVIGDHIFLPQIATRYEKVVMWTDTPLVDCNFIKSDNIVFVPASNFVKAILENCEVKNITEVVHKPMTVRNLDVKKEYDLVTVLTQPFRKGHDILGRVLRKLDNMTDKTVTLRLRVHQDIRLFFTNFKKIKITDIPETSNYVDFLKEVGKSRVMLFPSQVEGIGYPAIESVVLNQQLIMGDIDATREFVNVKSARLTDVKLVLSPNTNHWFLFQYYDEDEYLELLMKALNDEKVCKPTIKTEDIFYVEELYKKVFEFI